MTTRELILWCIKTQPFKEDHSNALISVCLEVTANQYSIVFTHADLMVASYILINNPTETSLHNLLNNN